MSIRLRQAIVAGVLETIRDKIHGELDKNEDMSLKDFVKVFAAFSVSVNRLMEEQAKIMEGSGSDKS